jgi:hypothetical protein
VQIADPSFRDESIDRLIGHLDLFDHETVMLRSIELLIADLRDEATKAACKAGCAALKFA